MRKVMGKLIAVTAVLFLFHLAPMAQADVGFTINVGGPAVVLTQPPDFLYPPELGFGVAVDVPYDIFYISGVYYLFRGGSWFEAPYWGGNWVKIRKRDIPPGLRRYKIGKIHQFRDREYRAYAADREHYRGQRFRPEGMRHEEHREMEHREMRPEEHREMEHRDMEHREMRPEENREMEHRDMR